MAAFTNWYNSHNFYGELKDIEAATLEDAKTFFNKYYTPQNAVLVVTGDFEEAQTKDWVNKYFANIPSQKAEALPDLTEPRQTKEKTVTRTDKLAKKPAGRFRVSNARARQRKSITRWVDRPDLVAGRRQSALSGTRQKQKLHERFVGRHQRLSRQYVQLQRSDAVYR
jgi:predicted Zn-dependent peptidase